MKITNKLAVITGASRGIGAATAQALAAEGAYVILLARTQDDLDKQVAIIQEKGGKAAAYTMDLSDHKSIVEVVAKIVKDNGTPDILVNSAGLGRWLFTQETDPEEAEMMTRLPYLGTFQVVSAFLPGMLARRSGFILNVNSPASIVPWGGAAAYTASRWALRGFSKSLRIDLHGTGVQSCHCVFGEVSSKYWEANPGAHERLPGIAKMIPVMTPEKTAAHIVKAIKRNKKELTKPLMLGIMRFFNWITPGIVRYVILKTSYKGN